MSMKGSINRVIALTTAGLLISVGVPAANATAVTVTYSANSSQFQTGYVSGTVPAVGNYNSGDLVTVASNTGNLARAGFTFLGWNSAPDGSGTTYTPGTGTFTIATSLTLYADWQIPASARLIGSSGSIVNLTTTNGISNGTDCSGSQIRGITSDGTYVYYRSSVNSSELCQVTMAGAVVAVHSITNLSVIALNNRALAYSAGCIFIRPDTGNSTSLDCIDMSNWTLHVINLPGAKPFIQGGLWLQGNLIDFPDGRIGAVSAPNQSLPTGTGAGQCPSGMYCKVLRLYTLAGSGASVVPTFSEDIILADADSGWPSDDHGISTDGTYLYEIHFANAYKVWALASGSPSYLVFNGESGSGSCLASSGVSPTNCPINSPLTGSDSSLSNATYLGRNNVTGAYLMGDYSNSKFYESAAATPPPGPGNPAPTFTSISPTTALTTGGGTATITGAGFTTATSVTIGGVQATIVSTSANSIVINIPANTVGVKDVVVNASTGSVTGASAFTVTAVYSITVTQGSNGSISPGTTSVNSGSSQLFTFTPTTGYSVETITVDGTSLSSLTTPTLSSAIANGYTFSNVASSHTLTAAFQPQTFSLTYSAGPGGSISGTASQSVSYGGSGTAVIALPSAGYHFTNWSDSSTVATRTDTNLLTNLAFSASFTTDTNTVTYSPNGAITGTVPVDSASPYPFGTTVNVLNNSGSLTRDGFTFTGWNTAADGSGASYAATGSSFTMPDNSVTLYAQWVQNSLANAPSSALTLLATFPIHTGIGASGTFTTASSSGTVTIPINALPDGATAKLYALGDISSLSNIVPNTNTYFLSLVLSWLTATGTVPPVTGPNPITMVITNSQIQVGTIVYGVSGGQLATLATATQVGTVTVPITTDPVLLIGNPPAQSGNSGNSVQVRAQTDSIIAIAPSSGSTLGGVKELVTGHFDETLCRVSNIFIDATPLPLGSWTVTSSLLSFMLPAHSAGSVTLTIYDGCAPVLDSLQFSYLESSSSMPVTVPSSTPIVTPAPTVSSPPSVANTQPTHEMSKLGTVHFALGSTALSNTAKSSLSLLAARLNSMTNHTVLLYGNSDSQTGVNNSLLSKDRAIAVRDYILPLLKGKVINIGWFAATKPAVVGTSKSAYAANRRVEIWVK